MKETAVEKVIGTREVSVTRKSVKELIGNSEGTLVNVDFVEVKKNLEALVKKHKAEVTRISRLKDLSPEDVKKAEALMKEHRDNRYALQNVRDHNSSVLASVSKTHKAEIEKVIEIVRNPENIILGALEAHKERERAIQEEIDRENEKRKYLLQKAVEDSEDVLKEIINKFTDYRSKESIVNEFQTKISELMGSIQSDDYTSAFEFMTERLSDDLQLKIDDLKVKFDRDEAQRLQRISDLKSSRMEKLFDYNTKYKGEKPLGELSTNEWTEILTTAILEFRGAELESMGFSDTQKGGAREFLCENGNKVTVEHDRMVGYDDAEWEAEKHEIGLFIDSNKAKEVADIEVSEQFDQQDTGDEHVPSEVDAQKAQAETLAENHGDTEDFVKYQPEEEFSAKEVKSDDLNDISVTDEESVGYNEKSLENLAPDVAQIYKSLKSLSTFNKIGLAINSPEWEQAIKEADRVLFLFEMKNNIV